MANISRRAFLISAAALPVAAIISVQASAASPVIHKSEGVVSINKQALTATSIIKSGDEITVPPGGHLVFSMGEDAFLVRGGSTLILQADENLLVSSLRLLNGALLGVFGKRHDSTTHIHTATATIGIRGTAVYVDVTPQTCYTCTCYGRTDLVVGDACANVVATHHNAHVVTTSKNGNVQMEAFVVKDHNDDELRMLEALVGRKPVFDI